ncbi:hypothetical protein Taro_011859 [Colocasia esculenta]|uniref:Uncharacterized protein n=1 Tax=Colocasia esculenta TaxID=4460 RepID=A0A843UB84_COLES|nr:hypothetical protein [Colocasia esculenta]
MCRQPEGSCRQVLLSRTMFLGFGLCLSTCKGHLSTGVNRSKERETCRGSHNSFNWSSSRNSAVGSTPPGTQQQQLRPSSNSGNNKNNHSSNRSKSSRSSSSSSNDKNNKKGAT